jgi:hypothetical protein
MLTASQRRKRALTSAQARRSSVRDMGHGSRVTGHESRDPSPEPRDP